MIVDKYTIRKQNEATVLSQIIKYEQISRAEVSKITNLNKATVSEITAGLIEKKLVHELGSGESSKVGGRKPRILGFNKRAGCSINVDLGYNYVSSSLTFLNGEVYQAKKEKGFYINQQTVVEYVMNLVDDYQPLAEKMTEFGIVGMTLAIHGTVNNNKIIFTPYYDLDVMDLVAALEEKVDFHVYVENEANLSAVAEATFSTNEKMLVSVNVYSGIGAGVIINRELYKGKDGNSGEIGHTTLIPKGKICPCGNHGCLEQYCSQKAVLNEYAQHVGKEVSLDEFVAAYRDNDDYAVKLINGMCFDLSIGINNLICHYSPNVIFINGSIFRRIPEMLDFIHHSLKPSMQKTTRLVHSSLGDEATLFGAAAHSIKKFLEIDELNLVKEE
ncbi:ROK family transcriptional regulator [Vagococcus acidifermentans]|uniref:Uncharacterized protein n=1 Tax=Vagococcus acidifermentans TaxID=564710 RepID=A0A430AXR3_9ENTE|nr:ROK family transcriptional regulator [Vagococcus acidifermentans]RSU12835.1 hypothetical protein CBF27_04670 [Vagococcus acidifermentans]